VGERKVDESAWRLSKAVSLMKLGNDDRKLAKAVNFGLPYGMGAKGVPSLRPQERRSTDENAVRKPKPAAPAPASHCLLVNGTR
jgi:hypothetical protein